MGYIRMVRSGGLHYCSNAVNFVPDLADDTPFQQQVAQDNLSLNSMNAAKFFFFFST